MLKLHRRGVTTVADWSWAVLISMQSRLFKHRKVRGQHVRANTSLALTWSLFMHIYKPKSSQPPPAL